MYCKLLDEAVREMKGEKIVEEIDTQIDLKITAYIPGSYIENVNQKIEIYQDIANAYNEEQISDIIDELIDRYGEIPKEIYNLLEVAKIKIMARQLQIMEVLQKEDKLVLKFNNPDKVLENKVQLLIDIYKNRIYFSSGVTPYITLKLQSKIDSDILGEVTKVLNILKG